MIILHASWITNEKKSDCGLFFWAENSKNIMRNTSDLFEPMINQSLESIETKLNTEYSFEKLNKDQFFLSISKLGKVLSQIDLNFDKYYPIPLKLSAQIPVLLNIPVLSDFFNSRISSYKQEKILGYPKSLIIYRESVMKILSSIDKIDLRYCSIPGIKLEFYDIISLLETLSDHKADLYNVGIKLADDLLYWIEIFNFSKKLILSHSIHPTFVPMEDKNTLNQNKVTRFIGWWDYFLNTSDSSRLSQFFEHLPASARLFSKQSISNNENEIVDDFIKIVINCYLRLFNNKSRDIFKPILLMEFEKFSDDINRSLFSYNPLLNVKGSSLGQLVFFFNKIATKQQSYTADERLWTLTLKLDPPKSQSIDNWLISFFFSNKEDETLIIPIDSLIASELEDNYNPKVFYYNNLFHDPINFFYEKLHLLSNIFPFMDRVIRKSSAQGFQINTEELFLILNYDANNLIDIGCDILIPSNFQNRLIPKSKVIFEIDFSFSDNHILDYDLSVIVKNSKERITMEQINQMVKSKLGIIEIGNKWVNFDVDEAKRIINIIEKQMKNFSILDTFQMQARHFTGSHSDLQSIKTDLRIKSNLKRSFNPAKVKNKIPNFKGKLRPYQKVGISWLTELYSWQLSACLADDMGLGKTIQILGFFQSLKNMNKKNQMLTPALVIVPTSILSNWENEFIKFAPLLTFHCHHGSNRVKSKRMLSKILKSNDVLITTYGTIANDINLLNKVNWQIVVIDEAQTIKNHNSGIFKSLIQLKSRMKIALTGTPVENTLNELWSIFYFLLPGYLGTQPSFQDKFTKPIMNNADDNRMKLLKRLTKPFLLRRSKSDKTIIQDLPNKIEKLQSCSMSKEQINLYEAAMQACLWKLENSSPKDKSSIIISTITKLKQICNHPSNFLGKKPMSIRNSGKVLVLLEIVKSITKKNEKVVIFTQYRQMGEILFKIINRRYPNRVQFFNGNTSLNKRQQMIEKFNHPDGGVQIMIITIQAGGAGINLTGANNVIHYDRWWNPSVENQATDRVYRIGQSKDVLVHKFITKGTIEDKINTIIDKKSNLVENYMSGISKDFADFSIDQIQTLMKLQNVELLC